MARRGPAHIGAVPDQSAVCPIHTDTKCFHSSSGTWLTSRSGEALAVLGDLIDGKGRASKRGRCRWQPYTSTADAIDGM